MTNDQCPINDQNPHIKNWSFKHWNFIGHWKLGFGIYKRCFSAKPALRTTLFVPIITFSISFIVYLFTLSPTIGLEDSGEFAAAVASLGVAHPSGYPLYVILGKLFTLLIPWGDLAWRVNLFSAFFASLTVALLTNFLFTILSSLSSWRPQEGGLPAEENPPQPAPAWCHDEGGTGAGEAERNRPLGRLTRVFAAGSPTAFAWFVAITTALAFAFSPVFWSQAVIAEVYTLNAFFTVLTLWLLWKYYQTRAIRLLYLFAFIYGLSLTNHPMMALAAPVYGTTILFLNAPLTKRQVKILLSALMLFIAGLALYLFVLWRAQADPIINWGHPDTLIRFWWHLTRRTYGDVQLAFWQSVRELNKLIFVHVFFADLLRQLTIIGLAIAVVGFVVSWFKLRALSLISLGVWLSNSLAVIFLRRLGYALEAETVYAVYYIPSFLVSFLWFGVGLHWLIMHGYMIFLQRGLTAQKSVSEASRARCPDYVGTSEAESQAVARSQGGTTASFLAGNPSVGKKTAFYCTLIILLLISLPISFLTMHWRLSDRSSFWLTYDWGQSLLEALAPDAVLVIYNEEPASDSQIFTLGYLHLIAKIRPDVAIVDFGYLSSRWFHPVGNDLEIINALPLRYFRARLLNRIWSLTRKLNRPLYTLWPVGSAANGDLTSVSNGLAHRVYPNIETARRASLPAANISLRNTDKEVLINHPYYLDFVSESHFTRAAYLLSQGHFKASEKELIDAFNLDQTPIGVNTHDYMKWRERWIGESQKSKVKSQNYGVPPSGT